MNVQYSQYMFVNLNRQQKNQQFTYSTKRKHNEKRVEQQLKRNQGRWWEVLCHFSLPIINQSQKTIWLHFILR